MSNHAIARLFIAVILLALAGCSDGWGSHQKLDGVYHAFSGGPITITIKGTKATAQIAGESKALDYKIEGDKLTRLEPKKAMWNSRSMTMVRSRASWG